MSLLRCEKSPIEPHHLVMYLAGSIQCYQHWYQILAFCLLVTCTIIVTSLSYLILMCATHVKGQFLLNKYWRMPGIDHYSSDDHGMIPHPYTHSGGISYLSSC
jgi:hypothetical protein